MMNNSPHLIANEGKSSLEADNVLHPVSSFRPPVASRTRAMARKEKGGTVEPMETLSTVKREIAAMMGELARTFKSLQKHGETVPEIVMRTCISQCLDYSWDYVASLFWLRYPNPFASHVLHEDTLERSFIDKNTMYTKRLIIKQGFGSIPFWLRKFISNRKELIVEESIINTTNQRILTLTRNVGGLARYAVVMERCDYLPPLESALRRKCTVIERSLNVKSSLASNVLYPLWAFLKRRYKSSAQQSLLGFNYVCQSNSTSSNTLSFSQEIKPHTSSLTHRARNHIQDFAKTKRPRIVMAESSTD